MVVREPQQLRSRESLERVLEAGIELLKEEGYEGLSIAGVCARANVSVGSIYARFKSKAGLFTALQVRILAEIDGERDALFSEQPKSGRSDADILMDVVREVGAHVRRHEAVMRVMILRGAVDEETRHLGSISSLGLADGFESYCLRHIRHFRAADKALAVDIAFRILYATLTRRVMSGPVFESRRTLEWDVLVAELGAALGAYLI